MSKSPNEDALREWLKGEHTKGMSYFHVTLVPGAKPTKEEFCAEVLSIAKAIEEGRCKPYEEFGCQGCIDCAIECCDRHGISEEQAEKYFKDVLDWIEEKSKDVRQ